MNISEIVTDVLDKLSRPLIQRIDYYIHTNPNEPEYTLVPFEKTVSWMLSEPYCDFRFEWDHAEFSLIQLCNLIDLLHGSVAGYEFIDELTKQVREMVEGRVQLFLDQQKSDEQRKLNYEHEMSVVT